MNHLVLISCCWLLKKTLVITTNLTNSESTSVCIVPCHYNINSNCISTISNQINETNSNSNQHHHISSNNFNDCNWTRTQNHLVLKRTLNHLAKLAQPASLAKWLSVRLRTKWFWVRVQLQSLHLQILRLLRARSSLTFRQL